MENQDYTQENKTKVRLKSLTLAINYLTKTRKESPLINVDYVEKVKRHILSKGTSFDKNILNNLDEKNIKKWKQYYKTIIKTKKVNELKLAYLCGPQPENDLNVMLDLGILPENIWAFESNKDTFKNAVENISKTKFNHIKIHKEKIDHFFSVSSIKFDLIYLDFCGTILSKNSIKTIKSIIDKNSLTDLGVLLTNFSLPDKQQDLKTNKLLTNLSSHYLYPKPFLENKTEDQSFEESPSCYGLNADDFAKKVSADPDYYYGQFITRLIMDIVSFIVPYNHILTNKSFFKNQSNFQIPEKFTESIFSNETEYPLLWTLFNISNKEEKELFSKLSDKNNFEIFEKEMTFISYMISYTSDDYQKKFYTEKLNNILSIDWMRKIYNFCDLFLSHQIKDLLIRQLCNPYHININKVQRWTYKAKDTQMFVDLFVLDKCRYLYDWLPSLDLIEEGGLNDLNRQLIFRFVLDGINKHSRWYNSEFLSGTAVTCCLTEKEFMAKCLKLRKKI